MRSPLERWLVALAVTATLAAGCSGADPSSEAMPDAARALAIAPDFAGTLWEATGTTAWRSQDAGRSWRRVSGAKQSLGVSFTEKGSEVVGSHGAQRGDYGGTGLSRARPTPRTLVSLSSPYHRTSRLYALDLFGGLWGSADAGRHWVRLRALRLPATAASVAAVRDDPSTPDIVYVACGRDGLWRSNDDGATFVHVPDPPVAYAVAMTTDDQRRVLVAGDQLYLSTDRGHTFLPVLDRRVDAIAFDPRNQRLAYAAAGRSLLRSVDGGRSWPN
jgi:photosystem II stability/assembly factor-like uncharacterized protein